MTVGRLIDPSVWFTLEIGVRAAAQRTGRAFRRPRHGRGPVDLFLCVVDHFEPQNGRVPPPVARERLEDWLRRYPGIVSRHRDSDGRSPTHSLFYPWDEFDPWQMGRLAEFCAGGWGEIELHLHHRDDTRETLGRKLREAVDTYRSYGALSAWPDGRPAFAFIHGDWALNNSRSDGGRSWCGVNDEGALLQEAGCYADLTFPAWKHTAQPRQINSLYFAASDPARPKGHDTGIAARAGHAPGPGLLLIPGPLVPHIGLRRGVPKIAMDDGDLAAYRRYSPARLDRWVGAGIHVAGRPDRIFIKLHTHGAPDANREMLLGGELDALFSDAEARYNDGRRYRLHYVTARQMWNVIQATIAGQDDDPGQLRDFLLRPPSARASASGTEGAAPRR